MKLFVKPEWSRQQQHRRRLAVERWSLPPPQLRRDVQEAEAAWGRQAALLNYVCALLDAWAP